VRTEQQIDRISAARAGESADLLFAQHDPSGFRVHRGRISADLLRPDNTTTGFALGLYSEGDS
jgi:hypothetical protein